MCVLLLFYLIFYLSECWSLQDSLYECIVSFFVVDNPSRMNPPSQEQTALNSSSSTALLNSSEGATGSHSQRNMAGFASLINLKEEGATVVTRGRRIQISQLGGSTKLQSVVEDIGPVMRKRWSFHSSNQICDILKDDKVMKPIISPKRRKSSALSASITDSFEICDEVANRKGYENSAHSKEQSQSSSRHVLGSRQTQARHQRYHHPSRKLLPLGQSEPSSSKRQRSLDEYLTHAEPYPGSYHQFRMMRKSKMCKEPPPPDRLSPLPDEVLLRVFKFLPKTSLASLGRTSQRFFGLIEDDSLWKRLCVMGRILNPEHLLIILSRKPMYLRMARTYIPDPDNIPSDIGDIAVSSQLKFLDLSSAQLSASTLALIMRLSPKLVKLSLEHLIVTKEVLESMMAFVSTVEVLNLTMCYELDATALIKFLTSCTRLKELNLGCMKVDWGNEELTKVCEALPITIQQLNISGFRNLLDDTHVDIIISRCPRLIELDISDSQEVQSKSVDCIKELPHLQHLGLSRCYGIEPFAYHKFANHKSLKYLDLFSLFKETSIRQLSASLPGIEINKFPFSAIARPTVGNKRSSIWMQRVRD